MKPAPLGTEIPRGRPHCRNPDGEDRGELEPGRNLEDLIDILIGSHAEGRNPRPQPFGYRRERHILQAHPCITGPSLLVINRHVAGIGEGFLLHLGALFLLRRFGRFPPRLVSPVQYIFTLADLSDGVRILDEDELPALLIGS